MVWLCDGGFIWLQNDLCAVSVHMQCSQNENETREGLQGRGGEAGQNTGSGEPHSIGRDALEPVIIEVEEHHLRLCGLQDEVPQLLHLQAGLEGQLQLTTLDHNVGEIQQVDLLHTTTQTQGEDYSEKHSDTYMSFLIPSIRHI